MELFRKLTNVTRKATMIEYGLVAALISVAIMASLNPTDHPLTSIFKSFSPAAEPVSASADLSRAN